MKNYQDRQWLYEHYIVQSLSCKSCGELAIPPVGAMTIHKWLERNNIPRRSNTEHMKGETNWKIGKPHSQATNQKIRNALLGRKRTLESRLKQSKSIKGIQNPSFGKPRRHGKTLRVFFNGQIFFMRSRWEICFAEWLTQNNCNWLYEPETFSLNDGSAYTPDFLVENTYYEVKGFLQPKDEKKIRGFRQTFPEKKLVLVDKDYLNIRGIRTDRRCLSEIKHLQIVGQPTKCCPICNQDFIPPRKSSVYCSVRCNAKKPKKPKAVYFCVVCNIKVTTFPSKARNQKACSRKCADVLRGNTNRGANHWTQRK